MPKSWSEAVKRCPRHPKKVSGRWCTCRSVGWRYRMGLPDAVTGVVGHPVWSETFPTKEAADAHQRTTRQAIADRSYVQDQGMTVAAYLDRWIEAKRRSGLKDLTVDGYAAVVANHLEPNLGAHRLGGLRPDHVQAMLAKIAREPARSRRKKAAEVVQPPTAGTLGNFRAVLRAALNDAVRDQLVPRNVAVLVKVPQPRREKPVALSHQQVLTFLAAAEDHQLHGLYFLVAVYGLRRGEAAGLSWDAVDATTKLIRVQRTVLDVKGAHLCPCCGEQHRRVKFDVTKTPAGERIYPLVPAVQTVLDRRRRLELAERALYGEDYADHGLIFARPDGNPWRPDWISSQFTQLMTTSGAAAGLPRVPSLNALRSTMVTNLHEAGTPLEVISRLTGHAGGEVTRDHYLHVSAERTRKEFTKIADRIAGAAASSTAVPGDDVSTNSQGALDAAGDAEKRSDPQSDPRADEGRDSGRGREEN